jgi:prepilin-type N-terminal cleavage/methylation domain-containing protein
MRSIRPLGNVWRGRTRSIRPSRAGRTLLEVMVTLVILTIIMAIVAPRFTGTRKTAQLSAASRDVLARLRYARDQAIVKGTQYRFYADTSTGQYWVEKFDANPQNQNDEPGYVEDTSSFGGKQTLPEGVTIARGVLGQKQSTTTRTRSSSGKRTVSTSANNADEVTVTFTPEGTSDASVFWLQNADGDRVFIELDAQTAVSRILADDEVEAVKKELNID